MNDINFCQLALDVIEIEAQAILTLTNRIDAAFTKACQLLLATQGRVVVTGMGKSGHIARKIAATLSSTGTPAFFMHPAEASHGDLGMLTSKDVVIALSYSGNTNEIIILLPLFKRLEIPVIALTGNQNSTLAQNADVILDVSIAQEACPLGLAPTTSTTVQLVMGDAIAVALLRAKGFKAEDFAFSHPGGSLSKMLLTVDDIAHHGEQLPIVNENISIREALIEVTVKKLGLTCVVNNEKKLSGVYTDGDIRRTLTENIDIHTTIIAKVMTKNCYTIPKNTLAAKALAIMQKYSISALIVVNDQQQPQAVVHLHDLLRAGVY